EQKATYDNAVEKWQGLTRAQQQQAQQAEAARAAENKAYVAKEYELPSLPVRVTEVACVAVTVNVEESPGEIDIGLATRFTVGAVAAATVTVELAVIVPPGPVAVAVYVVVVVGVTGRAPPSAGSV
ncbi:MAG: hypothetical protein V4587_08655, partial [Acidobacteriota bacterium]